ncbi:RmuC family protein [Granulibacter bethesdensis]|uniref:DNA recombination protein RmuC homolog n=1 Tax=Granulibacter bethesdensis TaxID=364410 RepID=A0AAC9KFR8_9PROT|nr:DNA recombination protein RmuC [Granulibacter bethesdensis]APH55493.1 RmuC family protein [Granulibacter bethesdensis]APH63079.1 RmuC family protein [Granulibacter bethesdensis]
MTLDMLALALSALTLLAVLWLVLSLPSRLAAMVEQSDARGRDETEAMRRHLLDMERALSAALRDANTEAMGRIFSEVGTATGALRQDVTGSLGALRDAQGRAIGDLHTALREGLDRLRESNETRLAEIRTAVNEQLHAAVEKQMTESFARVIDQFAAVQKAMGDVQAVTAQIGDIKRLFSNVKTRGGWGEAQVRAMLDDVLPPGSYETNKRLRDDSDEVVEFAVIMPMKGDRPVYLPIDAKFPVEDYERLLAASEAGDVEAERMAVAGLTRRIRDEARKIATKYVLPPRTVEFAVLYVPTDALYAEIARVPGLIDEVGRLHRVLVLGPSVFPALLRTIHLGHVTLALEQKADQIRTLLGATKTEMERMDKVLERLAKQAGTFSNTIESARVRTRAVARTLRSVEGREPEEAENLLATRGDGAEEAEGELF